MLLENATSNLRCNIAARSHLPFENFLTWKMKKNKKQSPQKHWSAWTCPLDTIQYWPLSGRHSAQVFVPSQEMLWSLWRRAAASLLTPHWTQPSFSWKCIFVGIILLQSLVSRSLPVLLPTLRQPGFMQRPLLHHANCGVAQLQTIYLKKMLEHVIVRHTVWRWLWYCTAPVYLSWNGKTFDEGCLFSFEAPPRP